MLLRLRGATRLTAFNHFPHSPPHLSRFTFLSFYPAYLLLLTAFYPFSRNVKLIVSFQGKEKERGVLCLTGHLGLVIMSCSRYLQNKGHNLRKDSEIIDSVVS